MAGLAGASRELCGASARSVHLDLRLQRAGHDSSLVAALESFMRRVPGSGPYMLDIRDRVDALYGGGAFMRGIFEMNRN